MDINNFLDKKISEHHNILKDNNGDILYLYHGTNRKFEKHSINKNRTILNDNYQGDWICYTDNEDVAWKYANAARNQNFDKDIFLKETKDFLKRIDIGEYEDHIYSTFINIMDLGFEKGWDKSFEEYSTKTGIPLDDASVVFFKDISSFEKKHDFYLDDIISSLEYVEYSRSEIGNNNDFNSVFSNSVKEIPINHIEMLKNLGYKECLPEPKVFKSIVSANNILKTSNREEAKKARENGFDLVIYSGEGTVDNKPEYLIANPEQVFIRSMNIEHRIEEKLEEDCEYDSVVRIERKKVNLRKNK